MNKLPNINVQEETINTNKQQPPGWRLKYDTLAKEWSEGCKVYSFWNQMAKHPAHDELLKMGEAIVPYILETLKTDHWIAWGTLLSEITGEQPDYEPDKIGGFVGISVTEYAKAWLKWGERKGFI